MLKASSDTHTLRAPSPLPSSLTPDPTTFDDMLGTQFPQAGISHGPSSAEGATHVMVLSRMVVGTGWYLHTRDSSKGAALGAGIAPQTKCKGSLAR